MLLALRRLLKSPGFTLVALLTLALGIGANTAIFSVVDPLLVRPLPVPQPDRLALLGQRWSKGQIEFDGFNYPLFRDYQRENAVFSQLAATAGLPVGLGTGGATERHRALLVSGNYFTMLGVTPALGRGFAAGEGVEPDDAAVVVLSHGLWQRRFGADPQVLGRQVTINGHSFAVIGVAPREFIGTTRGSVPDLYVPITMIGQISTDRPGGESPLATRYFTWHSIMGRLRDGVSPSQAQAAMTVLAMQADAARRPNTATNLSVVSGAQGFTDGVNDSRLPLHLLLATAALVLLIACANLANLQLARGLNRSREFAIRLALGAGRWRLVRELMGESILLSLGGGVLGMLVAGWLVNLLGQFRPTYTEGTLAVGLDWRILWFAFGASVVTGILFGLLPALRATRPQLTPELKSGGGTTDSRPSRWNVRSLLVILQVALSLLVLVSAGLCLRSLQKLQQIDPGFEPARVVLLSLDLDLNQYGAPQAQVFYRQLLERARTLPGVESAGLASTTPLSGHAPQSSVERVEGYVPGLNERPYGEYNRVSEGFFRALNLPLLRGRDIDARDDAAGPPVVIINQAFANRYFAGQDAVGKRIVQHGPSGGVPTEVIGVVGNAASRSLTDAARPAMYFPLAQSSELALTLAVRTGVDPAATIRALSGLVKSLDANVPVFNLRTLAEQKNNTLALQRMAATLLGGFGLVALLLAALGIYGVLANAVSRRTREIGVRMALGAQLGDVLGFVLKQGLSLTGIGLLLGLAGALAATRLLRGFLYQIAPLDPLTFGAVIGLLGFVAFLACWWPARRATRIDPMVALRTE